MLKPGDRVRFVGQSWSLAQGAMGTYKGGSEYVPGLDAGCFTVWLDTPDGNRRGVPHWTYEEVCAAWEPTGERVEIKRPEPPKPGTGIAVSSDPRINKLLKARRKAAENEQTRSQELIEIELRRLDPDGDWRYEGNRYDGHGWQVRRP